MSISNKWKQHISNHRNVLPTLNNLIIVETFQQLMTIYSLSFRL